MEKSEFFNDFSDFEGKIPTIKAQILTFSKKTGVKISTIADAMGVSKSNFRGKNVASSINSDAMVLFLRNFPSVSAEWLMRGTEPMLLTDTVDPATQQPVPQEMNVNNGVNLGKIGSDHTTGDADERPAGQKTDKKESPCVTCGKTDCIFLQAKQEVIDAQKITIETLRSR